MNRIHQDVLKWRCQWKSLTMTSRLKFSAFLHLLLETNDVLTKTMATPLMTLRGGHLGRRNALAPSPSASPTANPEGCARSWVDVEATSWAIMQRATKPSESQNVGKPSNIKMHLMWGKCWKVYCRVLTAWKSGKTRLLMPAGQVRMAKSPSQKRSSNINKIRKSRGSSTTRSKPSPSLILQLKYALQNIQFQPPILWKPLTTNRQTAPRTHNQN